MATPDVLRRGGLGRLRLGEGLLGLLELLARGGQLLLGLGELLLQLHDLLLGTVVARGQRALELADVRLQALVLLVHGVHLRVGAFQLRLDLLQPTVVGRGALLLRRGTAVGPGAQVVVLLDEPCELHLDDVEEGIDLFLVVAALADGRLLERDVVNFSRGQRHTVTSVLDASRWSRRDGMISVSVDLFLTVMARSLRILPRHAA